MKIIAKSDYIKHSYKKLMYIAKFILNKKVNKVINYLNFINNKSSFLFKKVLNSAIHNAENNYNIDADILLVYNVYINKGYFIKKIMPRAKGKADYIKKRTSRIIIILSINSNGTKSKS